MGGIKLIGPGRGSSNVPALCHTARARAPMSAPAREGAGTSSPPCAPSSVELQTALLGLAPAPAAHPGAGAVAHAQARAHAALAAAADQLSAAAGLLEAAAEGGQAAAELQAGASAVKVRTSLHAFACAPARSIRHARAVAPAHRCDPSH